MNPLRSAARRAALLHLLVWLGVLALVAAAGCSCGDDDDDDDASPDDDTAIDDDDTDDDDADDDIDDDDDADDDDTFDDDDADDDTGDDDTTPLGDPTYGFILLDDNREHISEALSAAVEYGMDNVQLSHDIIMDIDEINESPAKAVEIKDIADEAHALGLSVWVWAHEFAREFYVLCLDPDDKLWERRRKAYRDALSAVPEIDGVILMFGSSDVEPWYAVCFCQWCVDQPDTGNPLLDLINSDPPARLKQIYDEVGGVVMDEFGKELRVRTFMHQRAEIEWLRESLSTYGDHRLAVMSKDVPQDWQPYYPDNLLIGNVGHRHQIIEMDLGNEYWGASRILNGQVDYIRWRWQYDVAIGALGAAARIERGGNHALGDANEVNLFAYAAYMDDAAATPDDVYRAWFDERYGIAASDPASGTLKAIFRNSHFAMRKMYYSLGMWTLEKGSDVTDSARFPAMLLGRNTTLYDAVWRPVFDALIVPTVQTLVDLWQESTEAIELAEDNLAALESIEDAFADSDDYDELHDKLELHRDIAYVWRLLDDTVFRFLHKQYGHPEDDDILEWNADTLLDLADSIEARWGAGISPGNPNRIRNFVVDLRQGFPEQVDSEAWEPTTLYDIEATDHGDGTYTISWMSTSGASSFVEWGERLPIYTHTTPGTDELQTLHEVLINPGDRERRPFRVAGHDGDGQLVRSGDFWLGLDP
ncbi:hypothetical protein K8I61_02165 [bacterium]|nr:hypothetical protein [bacterium]